MDGSQLSPIGSVPVPPIVTHPARVAASNGLSRGLRLEEPRQQVDALVRAGLACDMPVVPCVSVPAREADRCMSVDHGARASDAGERGTPPSHEHEGRGEHRDPDEVVTRDERGRTQCDDRRKDEGADQDGDERVRRLLIEVDEKGTARIQATSVQKMSITIFDERGLAGALSGRSTP